MRVLRLEGDSPILGRVDISVPAGLVALVVQDGRGRRALTRLLRQVPLTHVPGEEGVSVVLEGERPRSREEAEALCTLWAGPDRLEGEEMFRVLAAAAAGLVGGWRVDRALARLGRGRPTRDVTGRGADPAELRARIRRLEDAPETLRRLERETRELRGDHAEVAGDLEAATMTWLRERQAAETHLQAYRDRARELKARLHHLESSGHDVACPTCGRVLGDQYDEVVEELREEWESVVQDGSWWKRRREQLELKPDALQEIEGRAVRLQAATESCAERLERARSQVAELEDARLRLGHLERRGGASGADQAGVRASPDDELQRVLLELREDLTREAEEGLLERASRYVCRLSGGRILGLSAATDRGFALEGVSGRLRLPAEEDRAVTEVSLRLAALSLVRSASDEPESMVLAGPLERLEQEAGLRTVELLQALSPRFEQILLVTRGDVVDLYPEAFDHVFELRPLLDGEAGSRVSALRALPAGTGEIRIGH